MAQQTFAIFQFPVNCLSIPLKSHLNLSLLSMFFLNHEYKEITTFPIIGKKKVKVKSICGRFRISIREGNGTPLQYSCLENPVDRGAWWAAVHEVTKSRTRLRDLIFTFHFHAQEKAMATHSSVLAWRIPGTGEPGGLPSMGSHTVRHD